MTKTDQHSKRRRGPPGILSGFGGESVKNITAQLNLLLDDVLALYVKTTSIHGHLTNLHFRDYGRLLQEQADQIFAMTDGIAGRICSLDGTATHSLRGFARELEPIVGKVGSAKTPTMLRELREDNAALIMRMLQIYDLCDDTDDCATANFLQIWMDETQRRVWFLGDPNLNREQRVTQ